MSKADKDKQAFDQWNARWKAARDANDADALAKLIESEEEQWVLVCGVIREGSRKAREISAKFPGGEAAAVARQALISAETVGYIVRTHRHVQRIRMEQLEKRIAALEAQERQLRYCGTYQRANTQTYRRNNFVTHAGCVWVALVDAPNHAPGEGGEWQLAVKSGRDAR